MLKGVARREFLSGIPRKSPLLLCADHARSDLPTLATSKVCCVARVISGYAIRRRCPLVSARRSVVCPRGTSRPPVRIRSASPFTTFISSHLRRRARVI